MQIQVNDEWMAVEEPLTLAGLMSQLDIPLAGTALALNQNIVPRERWAVQTLSANDAIAIFHAIAGG